MASQILILTVAIIGFFSLNQINAQNTNKDKNSTSISTTGGCRLYVGDIRFTKIVIAGTKSTPTYVYVDGVNLINDTTKPDPVCGNNTGHIVLDYSNIEYPNQAEGTTKIALDHFTLTWEINYHAKFRWWNVSTLTLRAQGDLIGDQPLEVNWTNALMQSVAIGGEEKFGYACQKPNELMFSKDRENGPIFKLQFMKLHLQPFQYLKKGNKDGFTDNVDDCVAFFSAGVWMALCTFLLFVLIIISGVVMLSEMTTINRFDDPKTKQLVIIAKD